MLDHLSLAHQRTRKPPQFLPQCRTNLPAQLIVSSFSSGRRFFKHDIDDIRYFYITAYLKLNGTCLKNPWFFISLHSNASDSFQPRVNKDQSLKATCIPRYQAPLQNQNMSNLYENRMRTRHHRHRTCGIPYQTVSKRCATCR